MNNPKLGQVFTTEVVADYMVSLFSIPKNSTMLDPCFGGGAFLKALTKADYANITGVEIDKYWFDNATSLFPNIDIINGDFLKKDSAIKYDGIIMNPPYIRHEKIDDLADSGITKELLFENDLFKCLPKTGNLYMFFIVKAIDLLRENGELIVIFPNSWMQAKGGLDFKKYLEENGNIDCQIDIYGQVFEGDAMVEVSILKITKSVNRNNTIVRKYKVSDGKMKLDERKEIDFDAGLSVAFSKYASVRRGLTTGFNEAFINPQIDGDVSEYLRPIISTPKAFTGFNTANAKTDSLLCITDDEKISDLVKDYLQSLKTQICESKKPKTYYEKIQQNQCWYKINLVPSNGLIFSYFVRNDMKFSLNTLNAIVRDNFYIIYPAENIDIYLLAALLNNYFTFYQLEKFGKKYGAGLLKLQRYDIENLKFPNIENWNAGEIEMLIVLGKKLITTGDVSLIESITEAIALAVGRGYGEIKEIYENQKKNRLERI